ncbi:hypothetical protein [Pseudohoeflea coraliihabitans]|uniref:Uncharacterized protein n=1 Tax=Pseudohoeflea coraliihabitans TaxID=2860393 RepID=A0ABS6WPW7_9HYPH|nr:hypothetical protein [Pseudohoeflea sp. DP4N28-3]MBW3098011.1 hypothetical protein [Pseudohoeflea sp. DP4N28-3]
MSDTATPQTCPFCAALWGTCEHYDVLAEWEESAAAMEGGEAQLGPQRRSHMRADRRAMPLAVAGPDPSSALSD